MTVTMDFLGAQRRARRSTRVLLALFGGYALASGAAYWVLMQDIVARAADRVDALSAWEWLLPWGIALAFVGLMAARAVRTYKRLADPDATLSEAGAEPVPLAPRSPVLKRLRNAVEEIAVAASLPVPSLWILPGQGGINAMAAGTNDHHGLLFTDVAARDLERDEIQAIAAHEIAHLASGDTQLNTLMTSLMAGAGVGMLPFMWVGGHLARGLAGLFEILSSEEQRESVDRLLVVLILGIGAPILPMVIATLMLSGSPVLSIGWLLLLATVPLAAVGLGGHILGSLLAAAVSRQREHHADALAVQLTRYPEALVRALQAVDRQAMKGHVITPQRARLDHFFFARPTIDVPVLDAAVPHPPLATRVARVRGESYVPPETDRQRRARRTPAPPRSGAGVGSLRSSLAVLPAPLLDACHDAALAPLAVLAVLASEGATAEAVATRAILASGVDPEEVYALKKGLRSGVDLLPAIEIAMPALRLLDAPARQRLADVVRALIAADEKKTLAEHAILQMLRWGFADPPSGKALGAEISRASDVLFAAIATAGSPLASARAEAVSAGRTALRITISLPDAPEAVPDTPFTDLDGALDILRRASRVQRHSILDAAHAVVAADGRTLRDETALLRASALALGVACVVHPEPLAPEAEGSGISPEAAPMDTEAPLATA